MSLPIHYPTSAMNYLWFSRLQDQYCLKHHPLPLISQNKLCISNLNPPSLSPTSILIVNNPPLPLHLYRYPQLSLYASILKHILHFYHQSLPWASISQRLPLCSTSIFTPILHIFHQPLSHTPILNSNAPANT